MVGNITTNEIVAELCYFDFIASNKQCLSLESTRVYTAWSTVAPDYKTTLVITFFSAGGFGVKTSETFFLYIF
jgi:hypothetical protein